MFLFLLLFWSLDCFGHTYTYHPKLSAYLGSGFSIEDPEASFLECVAYDSEEMLDGKSAYRTELAINAIQSQKELLSELGISASVSANTHFASGSAGVSYLNNYQFEENNLTWVLSAKTDFGRVDLEGVRLEPFAQRLLDEGKFLEFEKRCGTHFVSKERRGASIFAIYALHDLSSSQKTQLESYLKVSVGNKLWTGDLDVSFKKLLMEAAKTNHLDLHILTLGGDGLKQFSQLPQNLTDLEKIKEILGNYLNTLDFSNSVPLEYHITSMEVFGFKKDRTSDLRRRDLILERLYFATQEKEKLLSKLCDILSLWNTNYRHLTEKDKEVYQASYNKLTQQIDSLYQQAQSCLKDAAACVFPSFQEQPIPKDWPQMKDCDLLETWSRIHWMEPMSATPLEPVDVNDCEIARKQGYSDRCITYKEMEDLRTKSGVPVCVDNRLVTWIRCPPF